MATDGGYDTDTISLTSTVEEVWPEDKVWDAEGILAERASDYGEPEFLIRWRDFALDQCTWEPYEHLVDSVLPDMWEQTKRKWGDTFQAKNARNIEKHHKAQRDAQRASLKRKAKRAKKRELLQQKATANPTLRDDSDSDDDTPLIRRRASERARRVVEDNDSSDSADDVPLAALTRVSLSQKPRRDQDIEKAPTQLHNEPRKQHRGPFIGSSSSSSAPSDSSVRGDSEDSLMEEFRRTAVKKGQSRRASLQTPTTVSSRINRPTDNSKALRDLSKPGLVPPQNQASKTAHSAPNASRQGVQGMTTKPNAPVGNIARKPAVAQIRRSAPGAIKMVNKAVVTTRKEWQNSDKLFSTLKIRHSANKRGNREPEPDVSKLTFVNGPPETTPPNKPQNPVENNPYDRRESAYRRVQERSDNEREPSPRGLASWEKEKVPLICFEYRNNSCQYGARRCRFLHRQSGFPLAPLNGSVPGKYKKPRPITCWYYMEDPIGCRRSADDCSFAHYNTGLLAGTRESNGQATEIDPLRRPKRDEQSRVKTCWYWMEDPYGCTHSAAQCNFAHYNTGVLASRGGEYFQTTQIDPLRKPKSEQTLLRKPRSEQTCWFYMEDPHGCTRSASQCWYKHHNTGLLAPRFSGQATEIDPSRRPRSELAQQLNHTERSSSYTFDKKSQTCFFWTKGKCKYSAEQCSRAHYDTGNPPQRPPGWKDSPAHYSGSPLSLVTSNSNVLLVAEERSAPVIVNHAPPLYACTEMRKLIEDTCKLDFLRIFSSNDISRGLMDRRAFLIYHPDDHMEELELVTRWLLMSHVEVFNLWMPGSWDAFKDTVNRGGSGIIIVHDLILDPLKDIPDLGKLLRGNDVRVWCVGHQDPNDWETAVSPSWMPQEYSCVEMFPIGGIIVMTDDVFLNNPVEALGIVAKFINRVEECQKFNLPLEDGNTLLDRYVAWRLVVRPGIMQWLYDWCEAHEKQCEAEEPHAQAIMDLYFLLKNTGYCCPAEPEEAFRQLPPEFWPIMSERPVVLDGYREAMKKSHDATNRFLVNHYADWMLSNYRDYRHLIVVHPYPERWEDEIPLIDEVMTPGKCIEHFEQPARGNRFDFWEWDYKPLEQGQQS
ncbi:hypothetical protein K491DRAFT_688574 [Lophiostoma macrostomum CBS 122681]|uniref:Chromo domain-containing protein n=1 Tax=Lophiostoma macrostomum CBS 122681 TaxID=1314788 RepID=A0A6A6TM11_9PLEO|nr:hypothetical protein K491DRAFT_688574 [Lophiostoma macrostomum CBS 122681]